MSDTLRQKQKKIFPFHIVLYLVSLFHNMSQKQKKREKTITMIAHTKAHTSTQKFDNSPYATNFPVQNEKSQKPSTSFAKAHLLF